MKKHKSIFLDFETWHSWDLPNYTESLKHMPNNSLAEYQFRKNRSIGLLWFAVIGLCVTLVVSHWEAIAVWAKRHFNYSKRVLRKKVQRICKYCDTVLCFCKTVSHTYMPCFTLSNARSTCSVLLRELLSFRPDLSIMIKNGGWFSMEAI